MEKMEKQIKKLSEEQLYDFSNQNFAMYANDNRFYKFVGDVVLSHTNKEQEILDEMDGMLPPRKTMEDEMDAIYTITEFVNLYHAFKKNTIAVDTIGIVPTFNVYDYAKKYDPGIAELYLKFRKLQAIKLAKLYTTTSTDLVSYFSLEKRKDNYDINYLNKANTNSRNLDKSLKLKGYTI